MPQDEASAEPPTDSVPNGIGSRWPGSRSQQTVSRELRSRNCLKLLRPTRKVLCHMENSKINPREKLVVGVLTRINEELKLPKLDLHVLDSVLCRMPLCRKLHSPRRAAGDILYHPDIRSREAVSVRSERLVQIDTQRDSGRNKLIKQPAIDVHRSKLSWKFDQSRDECHHLNYTEGSSVIQCKHGRS